MCTRILYVHYKDPEQQTGADMVVTGRNMDWATPLEADIWAFPKGMKRDWTLYEKPEGNESEPPADIKEKSVTWTSKYGSVVTSALNVCSTDGMNTEGVVANVLFLSESDYDLPPEQENRTKGLSIAAWVQYVLDNFATVKEAVDDLTQDKFYIFAPEIPNMPGTKATLHLAIADSSGDSAIFEYKEGKLIFHHGQEYTVLTNSPFYDKQLAINEYWQGKEGENNGLIVLPGTNKASDRFARASFYLSNAEKTSDRRKAVATTFSIVRNVSVPQGLKPDPAKPNIASTLWNTVSDHTNLIYYFANSLSPSLCWVNLNKLDLGEGTGARRVLPSNQEAGGYTSLEDSPDMGGDVTERFEARQEFSFLGKPLP